MHPPSFDEFSWILEADERVLLDHAHLRALYERLTHERSILDVHVLAQIHARLERYDLGIYARFIMAEEHLLFSDLQRAKRFIVEAKRDIVSIRHALERGVEPPHTRFRKALKDFHFSLVAFRKALRIATSPLFVYSSTSQLISKEHLIAFIYDHQGPIASAYEIASVPPLTTSEDRLRSDFTIEQLRLIVRWLLTGGATTRSYAHYTVLGSGRDLLRIVIEKHGPFRKDAIIMIARNHTDEKKIYDAFITKLIK